MDSQKYPLFVQAGIDTTVAVPSCAGRSHGRHHAGAGLQLRGLPRRVQRFREQHQPRIANNYGVDCQGIRVPSSARSTYQFTGKLNYSFGTGSRLAFTALYQPFPGPHLPGESGRSRPVPDLWIALQSGQTFRPSGTSATSYPELDPEPVPLHRAGAGAGDLPLLPAGPHPAGSDDPGGRAGQP